MGLGTANGGHAERLLTPVFGNGDCAKETAFANLYHDNYSHVYNYVYYRLLDRMLAEDIVSEAFLKAARAFSRYDSSRAKFSTWVCAIARNCINDYFRSQHPSAPIDVVSEDAFSAEDEYPRLDDNAELARKLLATLELEEREIVFMKYFEDKRNKDIADELGMNPSTVATKLQRALAKMRTAAEHRGA